MIMLSRPQHLDKDSPGPTATSASSSPLLRPESPLHKSQSGPLLASAFGSMVHHPHHHVALEKVYIPGQYSERSTAFLHKHRRGGFIKRDDSTANRAIPVVKMSPNGSPANSPSNSPSKTRAQFLSLEPQVHPVINLSPSSSDDTVSESIVTPLASPSENDNTTIKAASSSESSGDDSVGSNHLRPQSLIRKKSGELVKSSLRLPSLLRTQSMPTKMVHFDTQLEHVRRFSRRERPTAVSLGTTPVKEKVQFQWVSSGSSSGSDSEEASDSESSSVSESEDEIPISYRRRHHHSRSKPADLKWQIALPNFSQGEELGSDRMVYLESVFLSSDNQNLVGHINVKNVSFEKSVTIRYSYDFWKSTSEVIADYNGDVRRRTIRQGFDRFTFSIRLSDLPLHELTTKSMYFCIRYQTGGQEFWDNNNALNYEILFTRVVKNESNSSHSRAPASANGGRVGRTMSHRRDTPVSSSPSGRPVLKSHHHRRTKTEPTPDTLYDDHDYDGRDSFSALSRDITSELFDTVQISNVDRLPSPTKTGNTLTSRYDFGASLYAALSRKPAYNRSLYDGEADVEATATPSESNSEAEDDGQAKSARSFVFPLSSNGSSDNGAESVRPAWDSVSYNDIINKYCFFQDSPTKPSADSNKSSAVSHSKRPPMPVFSPSANSPALVPQSAMAAATAAQAAIASSVTASPSPPLSPNAYSSPPNKSLAANGSDSMLDAPDKLWRPVEV